MPDMAGNYNIDLTIVNQTQYALKLTDDGIYSGAWGTTSEWRANAQAGLVIPVNSTGPTHVGHTTGAVDTNGFLRFAIQGFQNGDAEASFQFAVQNFPFDRGWVFVAGIELPDDLQSQFYVSVGGDARSNPVTGHWNFQQYNAP
jgi:hypothetical protein